MPAGHLEGEPASERELRDFAASSRDATPSIAPADRWNTIQPSDVAPRLHDDSAHSVPLLPPPLFLTAINPRDLVLVNCKGSEDFFLLATGRL